MSITVDLMELNCIKTNTQTNQVQLMKVKTKDADGKSQSFANGAKNTDGTSHVASTYLTERRSRGERGKKTGGKGI